MLSKTGTDQFSIRELTIPKEYWVKFPHFQP